VALSQIYADFLRYLLQHTQQFFEDRILDGGNIWQTYKPTMDVVVAHPNGWGIREQTFLRTAAVMAGFTSTELALKNVHFVTEAEASVHFCMHYTTLGSQLKVRTNLLCRTTEGVLTVCDQPGVNFAVCDAGGSTVDTTVYTVRDTQPLLQLEEKCASACESPDWLCDRNTYPQRSVTAGAQAGAIFVDRSAEDYLERVMFDAGLSSGDVEEFVKEGIKDFEGHAKRKFKEISTDQYIKIASSRYDNPAIKTRRGRMTLKG
jgi:hypothetical protein